MTRNLTLKIVNFKTALFVTQIECQNWSIGEDASTTTNSQFTLDKSKIDAENFNLISSNDVIFIDAGQLDNTPFASGVFKPPRTQFSEEIVGGFCQQIDAINETNTQYIIKTKSLTSNLDKTILIKYLVEEGQEYFTKDVITQYFNEEYSLHNKFGNPFINYPILKSAIGDNLLKNSYKIFVTEANKLYSIRDVMTNVIVGNNNNFFFYQNAFFNDDKLQFTNVFVERTQEELPPDVINLNEDFIKNPDLLYTNSTKINKVILYPREDNTEDTSTYIFEFRESTDEDVVLAEDFYTDDDLLLNESDHESALKMKALSLISGDTEVNEISIQMVAGVYDFFNLKLWRKHQLIFNGKTIDATLTRFSISSSDVNKIELTFGYKRIAVSSHIKKIDDELKKNRRYFTNANSKVTKIIGEEVEFTYDQEGNQVIEFTNNL